VCVYVRACVRVCLRVYVYVLACLPTHIHQLFLYHVVQFYDGVVEVCLCAANQKDLQGLALRHYKSGQPGDDIQGRNAFTDRYNSTSFHPQTACMYLEYFLLPYMCIACI